MKEPLPFELSDKTIKLLNNKAVRYVMLAKRRLALAEFDELNVMREIDALYKKLDEATIKAYKKLFIDRFFECLEFALFYLPNPNRQAQRIDDKTVEEMAEMYLFGSSGPGKEKIQGILTAPDDVTMYAYDTEILRKRDRAKESIVAANGMGAKKAAMDTAIRLWSKQMRQYADIVSDQAQIVAYKAAGIKRVRWVSQEDDRVCVVCSQLNGKVFRISNAPGPQHWNCRCYLEAVV